jgi:hypothetical protein
MQSKLCAFFKPFLLRKILFTLFLFCSMHLNAQVGGSLHIAFSDSLPLLPGDTLSQQTIALSDSLPLLPGDTLSQQAKDSLLKDVKYLLDLLNEPRSFFTFETSIGNRIYSLHNNIINARQLSTNKFTLVPSVSYIHKSGLGFSAAAYLTWEARPQFFQYALSPSWDHFGKKFGYGVSYAYYITRDDLEFYTTPIKNEVYGYFSTRKGWLRPRISSGWASGSYREITKFDTVILGMHRRIIDTSTVHIQDFSIMFSVLHEFSWNHIFSRKDNITLMPEISAVAGAQHLESENKGKLVTKTRLRRFVRKYDMHGTENTGLYMESLAFSLYATYYNGPLYISPQYFLSYFLGSSENKFSNIISLSVGVMF